MKSLRTEVAIVGAGPIGLELAVALKRRGIDYLHFDARQIGHTISWFAPQTRFFSSNERIAIAGVPLGTPDQSRSTREEYLTYLRGVVDLFDLQVRTYEPVVGIERDGDAFNLTTNPPAGRRAYHCRYFVLATGGTDRPRRLNVPGEDLPHVDHYFKDPHVYFRKRLLIVGGKNSAVEAAVRCHHAGAYVSLSYRREKFRHKSIKYWLMPEINALIDSGAIRAYFATQPTEITPTHVTLARRTETLYGPPGTLQVGADFVLLLIGYEADMLLMKLAGVELQGESQVPVYDPRTMQSSVRGIFVAGTAIGGTQEKYSVFIENCHVHVDRIIAALTGAAAPPTPEPLASPES